MTHALRAPPPALRAPVPPRPAQVPRRAPRGRLQPTLAGGSLCDAPRRRRQSPPSPSGAGHKPPLQTSAGHCRTNVSIACLPFPARSAVSGLSIRAQHTFHMSSGHGLAKALPRVAPSHSRMLSPPEPRRPPSPPLSRVRTHLTRGRAQLAPPDHRSPFSSGPYLVGALCPQGCPSDALSTCPLDLAMPRPSHNWCLCLGSPVHPTTAKAQITPACSESPSLQRWL